MCYITLQGPRLSIYLLFESQYMRLSIIVINSDLGPVLHRLDTVHPWQTDGRRTDRTNDNHDKERIFNKFTVNGRPQNLAIFDGLHHTGAVWNVSSRSRLRKSGAHPWKSLDRPYAYCITSRTITVHFWSRRIPIIVWRLKIFIQWASKAT